MSAREPVPDGVWMLAKGYRWMLLQGLARLLGAKKYPATQDAEPAEQRQEEAQDVN